MTTRNFRVHNGISVGDVVISATDNTITGLSTSAPTNPGDVATKGYADSLFGALTISGTEISSADSSQVTIKEVLSLNGNAIKNVGTPNDGTDAATKDYVDNGLSALSSNSITQNNTNVTITDSGSNGLVQVVADGNVEMEVTDNGVRIFGNLIVDGTETIINTQTLDVEDNIIGVNRNASGNASIPRFSGLHIHRGDTSDATEQDLYWLWDEQFSDDTSTIFGNAGGAFTALRSTHNPGEQAPNDDFALVDIRANVIHARATSAAYADIAERFAADAPMTEGAVVMLGGAQEITETAEELSEKVFGVISSKPAYMMNAGAGNNDSHPFVAMTGRTPVRVTGVVNKGDRIVSSSVKGTARAARTGESINPFHVIGRALESKSDAGIGLVNCFVQAKN